MRSKTGTNRRTSIRVLQIIMVVFSLIMFGRVFQLQILQQDKYAPLSEQNSFRQQTVHAARGLIFDRKGKLLVDNEPVYSVTITPANFEEENIPLLANLLNLPVKDVAKKIEEAQSYSWHRASRLYTEINFEKFSRIQENIWRLPGIGHQIDSKRHYAYDLNASHILGYLRESTEADLEKNANLELGDKVGKSGLELAYEHELRGSAGLEYIRVNALGQSLGSFDNGKIDIKPSEGNNLITTIDAELQAFTEKLMTGKRGAVVAMDPSNGEVLTLVSSPDYDVRKLAGRIKSDYWVEINTDSTTPLYNRAISSLQPPGSTFKPIMGLAGLELGIITPDTKVYNSGAYIRGRAYADLADIGEYDLQKAITYSSNTYFFWLMDKIASSGKLNQWHELVTDFGLGVRNGIDLPFESLGIIPDSTRLNNTFGEGQWGLGDLINLGVGQGLISVSPLQVSVMTSAIANGGYKVQPHLVREIHKTDGKRVFIQAPLKKIHWVNQKHIDVVRKGMRGVVTEGSGRYYANLDSIKVAGKTGTAQNPHGQDHGWFTSFAPMEHPKIVVTVLIENGGYGSISAAPIAGLVIEKYLNRQISQKRKYVYDYVLNFKPKPVEEDTLQSIGANTTEAENETSGVFDE